MSGNVGRIVLIGFMGSGKSSVGRELATRLGFTHRDTDLEILDRSGCSSIGEIFAQFGEPHFRALESQVCDEQGTATGAVVSCGGGVVELPHNMQCLGRGDAEVVFLRTSFEHVFKRATNLANRPLFTDVEKARLLFERRAPIYLRWADSVVDTDGRSIGEVCEEIVRCLALRHTRPLSARITANSELTCIIGDPVHHSLSPTMHNAGYRALRLPFVMAAAAVPAPQLPQALLGVRALGVRGLSVTMPHKVEIIPHLDELDETARAIGAVNTVVQRNGRLIGYNTDWLGVLTPLKRHTTLADKRVAVIGAGGAAQAALYACRSAGARVTLFNRSLEKAEALATRWGCAARPLDALGEISSYEVVINASSVGMGPLEHASPIDPAHLHREQVVFETIYAPRSTQLVQAAERCGATVIRGIEMFVEQGIAQFELHTGVRPPRELFLHSLGGIHVSPRL